MFTEITNMFKSLGKNSNIPLESSNNTTLIEEIVTKQPETKVNNELNDIDILRARLAAAEKKAADAQARVDMAEAKVAELEAGGGRVSGGEITFIQEQSSQIKFIIDDKPNPEIKTYNRVDDVLRPRLLVKPCQAGKTGEALTDWVIKQSRNEAANSTEVQKIAFFVCDNSLLLTKQTEIRAKDKDTIDIQGDIVIISCKDKIKCIDKLFSTISRNSNISTILCCGNARRLKDISELSDLLKKMVKKYEITIYVDEADKILHSKSAQEQVKIWRQSDSLVKHLLLITATPFENTSDNLIEDYGEIELLPVQTITSNNYHRFSNSRHIDTTSIKSNTNVDYVAEVFANFISDGPALGEVYFIPAEHKKETHDEMQELLLNLGFNCVIKINATSKEIIIINDCTQYPLIIPFSDIAKELKGTPNEEFSPSNNEISRWLGNYYSRNNGKDKWIMAITGNICISRGISIQSADCFITHAIYGPKCACSKKNLYQIFARICGNILTFPKYTETGGPIVYCSKKDFDECCRMEQLAINLATYSQSNGDEGGVIVDREKLADIYMTTEKEYECKTVPIVHDITDEEYSLLRNSNERFDKQYIIQLLKERYDWVEAYAWENGEGIQQITEPDPSKSSYKKHITDLVTKSKTNKKAIIDRGKNSKKNNNKKQMWIYVDKVNKRLVITRWDGSKA